MRKFLAIILVPFLLSTSSMARTPVDTTQGEGDELKPIIEIAMFLARALITYRFTAVLAPLPDIQEEIVLDQAPPQNLSEIPLNEEEALRALEIGSLINPKGILTIRTNGFFSKRFDWKIKTRFLGEVTHAAIYCKPFLIFQAKVGVTLYNKKLIGDESNWGSVKGRFSAPDLNNGCDWKDYNDVLMAMFLGNAFFKVKTVDNPEGALEGNILNIGLDSD